MYVMRNLVSTEQYCVQARHCHFCDLVGRCPRRSVGGLAWVGCEYDLLYIVIKPKR